MAENKIELENIEVPMKRVGSAEEPDAKRPKQYEEDDGDDEVDERCTLQEIVGNEIENLI